MGSSGCAWRGWIQSNPVRPMQSMADGFLLSTFSVIHDTTPFDGCLPTPNHMRVAAQQGTCAALRCATPCMYSRYSVTIAMVPSACAAGKTWDGTWRQDGSGSGRWNMGHTHGLPGPFRTIAALRPDQRGSKRTRGLKDDSNARPPVPSTKRATRLPYYLPGECAVSHISHLPSLLLTLSRPCLPRCIISLCLRHSTSNEQPITFLCQTWAWPALKETPSTPDQTRPDQTTARLLPVDQTGTPHSLA